MESAAMGCPRPIRIHSLLALVAVLAAEPALAQSDPAKLDEARKRFAQAEVAYRLGQFQEALTHYQAAYAASLRPELLFNIAQCYRQQRDPEKALFYYQLYLSDWERANPGKDVPYRAEVDGHIAAMKVAIEEKRAAAPPSVPTPAPSPDGSAKPAPSGDPAAVVPDSAKPDTQPKPVDQTKIDKTRKQVKKEQTGKTEQNSQTAPSRDERDPPRWKRPLAWVAAGVAVASLATGAVLLGIRRVDELEQKEYGGPLYTTTDSPVPGAVLLGVGAAAGGLCIYLFARREQPVRVGFLPMPGGGQAALSGSF